MIKLPKITVITATFNLIKDEREHFFRQCVESVHNQTYPNIEHIVMDGASTDGTLDLIKEYEEKGWLKCYSEPDEGMWEGMNKGLKVATGKYITFLNSDDLYHSKDILEKAVQKLEESGADYLYADFILKNKNDEFICNCGSSVREEFFVRQPFNHESLVVKKEVYEKLGGYNCSYETTIDYAFICSLIMNDCSAVYLDRLFFTARLGGGTTETNGKPRPHVIKTVTKLYKDLYSPFWNLSDDECYKMFIYHQFTPSFLEMLKLYMTKKDLKNFNYVIFFDLLKQYMNNTNTDSTLTSKIKETYYLFGILPFLTKHRKNKIVRYKLLGFIPIMNKKEK